MVFWIAEKKNYEYVLMEKGVELNATRWSNLAIRFI